MNLGPTPPIRSNVIKVAYGYEMVLTYWPDDGRLNCAWQPEMPPRKLEGEMLEGYEQALGVFMQLVADTLDRPIVLYDHDIVRMVAPAVDYEVH